MPYVLYCKTRNGKLNAALRLFSIFDVVFIDGSLRKKRKKRTYISTHTRARARVKKTKEKRAFRFEPTSLACLERRKRLRLLKTEMGTLARDDFYEALRLQLISTV